ncbi:hypothetical protein PTSG_07467 [Salpingoeca rosetta]|uniref:Uncharacterized protein n=1 Tax=Salpingoeca rosetta (strain ATCC 50818 / BSB-021) TaxID=946362 RepID=F2UIT4_SALR5|nr:uncharacterized protein PTSG_07467 [Salpingoeca rosetta]EGD77133.1 hypothetical protein PTSG_07467 [Salpingoeca rosetta]|eukprot:XP_004990972.1 hypothetical protein PTSG_07467 [Salpingoeca rosetta]
MTTMARRVVAWYMHNLRTRPIRTNMGTSAVLMAIGDTIAQQRLEDSLPKGHVRHTIIPKNPLFPQGLHLDLARTSVMTTWSALMGIFWTIWFRRMDLLFAAAPHRLLGVAGKVATTAVFAQPLTNTTFLSGVTAIEEVLILGTTDLGKVAEAAKEKLRAELWNTLRSSWMFWSPCNVMTWTFFPAHTRVAFGGVVSMVWNVYLSFVEHRAQGETLLSALEIGDEHVDNSNSGTDTGASGGGGGGGGGGRVA